VSAAPRLAARLLARYPDEAAQVLDRSAANEVASILLDVETALGSAVLGRLMPALAVEVIELMPEPRAGELLAPLPPHRIARLARRIPPERWRALAARLPAPLRSAVARLVAHEPGTAGSLMDPLVLALPQDADVETALNALRDRRGTAHDVYVTDRDGVLVGVAAIGDLLAAAPSATLGTMMERRRVWLRTTDDRRAVLAHPGWATSEALPVVDDHDVVVGVMRHRTVRRLELESVGVGEAPIALAAELGELTWLGLIGITEGIATVVERASTRPRPEERTPGAGEHGG
jgi:magnesium transporter